MVEWKKLFLGDVVILHYGKGLPSTKRACGKVPVYSSAGLTGYHDEALVETEGLVIGRKGTIGKIYKSDKPFFAIDTTYYIKPNPEKYDLNFMYYFFQQLGLEDLNEDSAVPGLNRNTVYSQEIYFPSLPIQKAIAEVLSSLDDKIDLLHRQNKTLEALAETLFRQWFVEEASEDWEETCLGEIALVQNGYAFNSKDYVSHEKNCFEVFKMGHIAPGGGLRYSPKADFVPKTKKLQKWCLKENDIVMAMTDMKDKMGILGHPAMVDEGDKYVLNQRVARIYLKNNERLINNYFLYLQLNTANAIASIQNKAHGGVQVNLSTDAIKSIPIIIPPLDAQNKGFSLLHAILAKNKNNRQSVIKLERFRDMLLPSLMNNETKVLNSEC